MVIIDTLGAKEELERSGFTEEQAKGLVGILSSATGELVTKDDLRKVAGEMKADLLNLTGQMERKFESLENRLKIFMVECSVAGVGILAAIHFFD